MLSAFKLHYELAKSIKQVKLLFYYFKILHLVFYLFFIINVQKNKKYIYAYLHNIVYQNLLYYQVKFDKLLF